MASAWTSVGNLWNEWMKKWMEKINEKDSVIKERWTKKLQ
jgi:hypothetical protein